MDAAIVTEPTPAGPVARRRQRQPRRRRRSARAALRVRSIGVHRVALARAARRRAGAAAVGRSSRAFRTATTPTRRRTSSRARSASSAHDLNPHYFLNPPAYSYLLYIVFELWFGGADAVGHAVHDRSHRGVRGRARRRRRARDGRRCALTYLAGTRLFGPHRRAARGGDPGGRVPPGLLQPPGAQRRADAGAGDARRCTGSRACCGAAARATTRSPASGSASRRRRSTRAGSRSCACSARPLSDAAARFARRRARRLRARAGVLALVAFLIANPYALLDSSAFLSGVSQQASLSAGQDPVKLGTRAGSGITYYLWTFTWGLGWGADAGGARRRGAAGWRAAVSRALLVLVPRVRVLHRVHGRSAAVLRALADADLPDRRAARRVRRGRARARGSCRGRAPAARRSRGRS